MSNLKNLKTLSKLNASTENPEPKVGFSEVPQSINLKSLKNNGSLSENSPSQDYLSSIGEDYGAKIMTGNTLLESKHIEISWIIENLIPKGLSVLTGDPKVGKSKLVRIFVLGVLLGILIWDSLRTVKGSVVYISFEENENSVALQLSSMLENRNMEKSEVQKVMSNFSFVCPGSGLQLGDMFDDFIIELKENIPSLKLVIIDPLGGSLGSENRGYSYVADYQTFNRLQQLALKLDLGILAIHHTRKLSSPHTFHMMSGTQGLRAAAELNMLLQKADMSTNGILSVEGRSVESKSYKLKFNEQLEWEYVGEKMTIELSPERQDIVNVFIKHPGQSLKSSLIAKELGKKQPTVSSLLKKLKQKGVVEDGDLYGEYRLTTDYETKLKKEG